RFCVRARARFKFVSTATGTMDDFQSGEESIESTVGSNTYSHSKVQQWTSSVIEQCLNHLTKLGKPFKYVGMVLHNCVMSASNLRNYAEERGGPAYSEFMLLG
ncbi:dynein light chain Tctex-type 1, partial [Paragonimus westermani]